MTTSENSGPLAGVRVLQLGGGVAAAFACKLLADDGADVITVEPPTGDRSRTEGPFPGDTPHPERSAPYLYLNTSKRSLVLDLTREQDRDTFRELAAGADLLVEGLRPGVLASVELGHDDLARANPRLVTVSLSAFGQDGPYAGWEWTNLTAFAMGGQMAATGEPDQPPLKNGGAQAEYQLGLAGFAAATIALYGARATGRGQHVDVAAMEAMASVLEASLNTWAYTGRFLGPRRGNMMSAQICVIECADGYLGLHAMPRNYPFLLQLMGMPDLLQDERFATAPARLANNDELMALYYGWALGQTKKETYEAAGRMRAPVAYVHTLDDLRASPQLEARGYWHELDHPEAGRLTYPGPPFLMSDSPARLEPAPLLGSASPEWEGPRDEPAPVLEASPTALPLTGVRVLDLTMVWAGPYGTRILGDMGAEVIKVEASRFYDQLRNLGFTPPGTERPWDRAAYFNHNNRDKYGLALDLAGAEGRDLLLELVKTADVVVENYRAEVMDRLGLGYETLRETRPDIIMVSMPGHGKTGPERDYVAYGTNIEQLSGLVSLSGYEGGPPQKTGISYGDPMSGTAMAGAVAAALLHRNRTGRGQYIELAQREVMTALIGEYVVAHSMNGRQPPRIGNHHPTHAPHNVYPTADEPNPAPVVAPGDPIAQPAPEPYHPESWVTIACESDEQFGALCGAIGRPELADDPHFATEPARKEHEPELDALIGEWTGTRGKWEIAAALQAAGVPCGPVLAVPEIFANPHLRARGFFEHVTHPVAGTWDMEGPLFRLSETPVHIRLSAPCFGEHTAWALGHLLGLPNTRLAELETAGITGTEPDMSVHQ